MTSAYDSVGIGQDAVVVDLGPGQEAVAAQIEAKHGNEVQLTVGTTTFCHGPGLSTVCPSFESGSPPPHGLRLVLTLSQKSIEPTDALGATLTVTNEGPGTFMMDTGQPLVASIVTPGSLHVVGSFSGSVSGTGFGMDLPPGQSHSIPVIVGTSRCDGGRGSALPAGHYGVRVAIEPETQPPTPRYLAPEVGLTVR